MGYSEIKTEGFISWEVAYYIPKDNCGFGGKPHKSGPMNILGFFKDLILIKKVPETYQEFFK